MNEFEFRSFVSQEEFEAIKKQYLEEKKKRPAPQFSHISFLNKSKNNIDYLNYNDYRWMIGRPK